MRRRSIPLKWACPSSSIGYRHAAYYGSDSIGEPWLRNGGGAYLADRRAGERQGDRRTHQCQCAGQDKGGVEVAGRLDEVAGDDRREEAETVAAEHEERKGPAGVGR